MPLPQTEVKIFDGGGSAYNFVAFAVVAAFICSIVTVLLCGLAYSCPNKLTSAKKMWRFAYKAAIATAALACCSFGVFIVGPVGLQADHLGAGWPCTVIAAIAATVDVCTLNCSQSASGFAEMADEADGDTEMQARAGSAGKKTKKQKPTPKKPRRPWSAPPAKRPPPVPTRKPENTLAAKIGRVHRDSIASIQGGRNKRGTMTPGQYNNNV